MREANVQVRHRKKYKVTIDSKHKQPVFENLIQRQFEIVHLVSTLVSEWSGQLRFLR